MLIFFLLVSASVRSALLTIRRQRLKKLHLVANSFLSWLTFKSQHQLEHITMAETLFAKNVSDRSIRSYEVMGYFNRDVEHLKQLEDQLRIDSFVPVFELPLPHTKVEYLTKFATVSPEVFCTAIGKASSPFLQIRALRLLRSHINNTPDLVIAPELEAIIAAECMNFPQLYQDNSVRSEVRLTLEFLHKRRPTAAAG